MGGRNPWHRGWVGSSGQITAPAPVRKERQGWDQPRWPWESCGWGRVTKWLHRNDRSPFPVETIPHPLRKPRSRSLLCSPTAARLLVPLNRSCWSSFPSAGHRSRPPAPAQPCRASSSPPAVPSHPLLRLPLQGWGGPSCIPLGCRAAGRDSPWPWAWDLHLLANTKPRHHPLRQTALPKSRVAISGMGERGRALLPGFHLSHANLLPAPKTPLKPSPSSSPLPHQRRQHPGCSHSPRHLQLPQPSGGSGASGGQKSPIPPFRPHFSPPVATPSPGRKGEKFNNAFNS